MGQVYLADDTLLARRVALKVLQTPEEANASEKADAAKRILREAPLSSGAFAG